MSSLAALAWRGLLEVEDLEVYGVRPTSVLPHVKLTLRGRKLARHLYGDTTPPPPKGVISLWAWRALALA